MFVEGKHFSNGASIIVFGLIVLIVPACTGQDNLGIYGVYSEASLGGPDGIAPGSNMLIFSGDFPIGPAVPRTADGFPLLTSLAGASVRVTSGSTAIDAYILGTETQWIRALLPSNTPLGNASLVVTYNGRSSVPYRLVVRATQFGIYDGSWCGPSSFPKQPGFCVPRAVQNVDPSGAVSLNSFQVSARPGQLVTLWGTGLGAASGDEAVGPVPVNRTVPGLKVLLGGQPAKILYSGRSGCCAGMDQIVFEVPPEIEGCNVPIWVRFNENGSTTQDILVAIANSGGACSDPQGLTADEVRQLAARNLNEARIWIGPQDWSAQFGHAASTAVTPYGTCFAGWGLPVELDSSSLKDAGPILNLHSPQQTFTAARYTDGTFMNFYSGLLDGALLGGDFVFDNGEGGLHVGPFQAKFSVPPYTFRWTNQQEFAKRDWREPLTVSWEGAGPAGSVVIYGSLASFGEAAGTFACTARPDSGSFTIPVSVLERSGAGAANIDEFTLTVAYQFTTRIPVPGLDLAEVRVNAPPEKKTIDPR